MAFDLPQNPLENRATDLERPSSPSLRRLYVWAVLLCVALVAAALSTASWMFRRESAQRLAGIERNLLVADSHGVRLVALADAVIMQVLWSLDGRDPAKLPPEQIALIRRTALDSVPAHFSLDIWQADGHSRLLSSRIDASGREDFRYQIGSGRQAPERELMIDPNRQLFISGPLPGAREAEETIYVSRPIATLEGQTVGVVSVGIPLQSFVDVFKALVDREGDRISLFRNDGTAIARYPSDDVENAAAMPGLNLWARYPAARTGHFNYQPAGTDVPLLAAFVGLEPLPLVVVYATVWQPFDRNVLLAYWPMLAIAGVTLLAAFVYARMSIRYAVALGRSNADLALARDGLRREAEGRGIFIAKMNHELRTPLNAIVGFAQILSDATFGPLGHAKYSEYARDIADSGNHLLMLIGDIIDFSTIDVGSRELRIVEIDASILAEEMARLLRPVAADRKVTLRAFGEGVVACGDEIAVRQILMNLVSNAIKFSPAGAQVDIVARNDETSGMVAISVVDRGPGIAPEDLSSIGKPFFRTRASRDSAVPGTGLGLSISTALAHRLSGRLTLASAPGLGTTVTLMLPRAPHAVSAA
ncbi:MAG: hypothetical protein GC202_13265 [Alphaproteobacteria bacterium]|nr:hypothetical protein [Alphaproteobacteria bacterium]